MAMLCIAFALKYGLLRGWSSRWMSASVPFGWPIRSSTMSSILNATSS